MDMDAEAADKQAEWSRVAEANDARQQSAATSQTALSPARDAIEKFKAALHVGKENPLTERNDALAGVERELNELAYSLDKSVTNLNRAVAESKVMTEYQDLVRKGREQFRKELESIVPEVKLNKEGQATDKLTEDEMNSLIAHAHRRIEQLQAQLADQQALETIRTQRALDLQREEDEALTRDRVKVELARQAANFDVQKEELETEARVTFEKELRYNLARQAAAHSDHLAEVLKQQERELVEKFDVVLTDKLIMERDRFQTEVAGHIARLRGIEAAIEARADTEAAGRQAQQLWLAVQALQSAVTHGRAEGSRDELNRLPLAADLEAVCEAGAAHPFVAQVARTVRQEAAEEGVWRQEDLARRFRRVRRVCRQVALVDAAGGTLFQHLVSRLQAVFVLRCRPLPDDAEVDPAQLDTFALVDNAQYALERGDLEQALRYVVQLRGEARRAARDWVREARLVLEARQAADALLAHAAAAGLTFLF